MIQRFLKWARTILAKEALHPRLWTVRLLSSPKRNGLRAETFLPRKLSVRRGRGKEYSYWLFLDDDVEIKCNPQVANNKAPLSLRECWQKVFNFISSDEVPEKVSTIAVLRNRAALNNSGSVAFSNADAMFAAFKRERVPYLLPYATLQEG